jgi:hypothetical protein
VNNSFFPFLCVFCLQPSELAGCYPKLSAASVVVIPLLATRSSTFTRFNSSLLDVTFSRSMRTFSQTTYGRTLSQTSDIILYGAVDALEEIG